MANTDHGRKLQSNFTVMLTNGIGFQVAENDNTLQLDLMAPNSVQVLIITLSSDVQYEQVLCRIKWPDHKINCH